MPIQFKQHIYKSSFLSTIEKRANRFVVLHQELTMIDRFSLSSVPELLFWAWHGNKPVISEDPSKLAWCVQTFSAVKRHAPTCSVIVAVWWNSISTFQRGERYSSRGGTNPTASDGLDNFIRQRMSDMPQCPDVMIIAHDLPALLTCW